MEVAFPKRKPIPASKRMVAPVSTPIHLILEAAEQDLLTRSLVKMRTMGGNAGSTYPGSFDFDREKKSRKVKPERLDVLEFGSKVALEIVLNDEDAEKIGIAAGAENVPGKCSEAKGRDGGGVKEAKGVAPALGEERPEENSAAGENDGGGTFGEDGEAEEETE